VAAPAANGGLWERIANFQFQVWRYAQDFSYSIYLRAIIVFFR
jgi:hypothetical protein